MDFRTVIPISPLKIMDYEQHFLLLGSCFAETIGRKLLEYRFTGDVNPFGVLYNPFSIADVLERLSENRPFVASELFNYDGWWHSWAHHGSFSAKTQEQALANINTTYLVAAERFEQTDVLILTFGSAWVYEHDGSVVANCHKVPEREFTRRRLSVDEIVERYTVLLSRLLKNRPYLRIVFSVSPIRYLRNGATENQTSKSILLLATEALCRQFEAAIYFPSYEIVLDELRDYRFFADDMIHPSSMAVEYVWERFCTAFFTEKTLELLPQVAKINKALQHRPLKADSEAYRRFIEQIECELAELKQKYPYLNI
ncbi:MAG TPA: GSCFA domain-containing protein [Paludibacteraceae bacterium]|nr:GSCFA domain-containing protein [Paludibacteraceae bacterium]HOS36865.1 GSCFA domain-containing protein [Paludibacteraceae bacterium]HPH72681.1 GSCFA domain-containing protein [Paludibacteraceae bacterium]HPK19846.1 GSCFA domain-containing protein [Paludibacteraceae bacterium]HPO48514.1 GSCFA domain-containing protein [Paludibacteraceae bacterium]